VKITKEQLREIIQEEIQNEINSLNETQARLTQKLIGAMKKEVDSLEKRKEAARSQEEKREIQQEIDNLVDYLVRMDPSYRTKKSPKSQSQSDLLARLAAGSL
tara:strand:- start:748 stop:1056 length:309 start_codon:yes stop_codon:yes gene_type:complete